MKVPGARRRPGDPVVYDLELAADLLAFQGHFPGHPILPGVVQVDWAIHFGTQAFGPLGAFLALEHLKFTGILEPGDTPELSLAWDPDRRILRFTYASGGVRKSSGSIRFAEEMP
jgi:3-hydroxyacyl-[acyl-carrier-protein] dehydratase